LRNSLSLLVLFFVAATFNSAAVLAQNRTKLVIGYSAMQALVAPLWVAEERGFFTKYGVEPQLVFVRTTSVHMAGLVSGQINLSYGGVFRQPFNAFPGHQT
jgi:NitT/TauT family transport system substrate-binding protein